MRINPSIEEDIPPLENIEKKVTDQTPKKIDDAEENTQIKIRGTVVQILERDPIFKVCPQCGRKVAEEDIEAMCEKCEEVVEPENRVVVNVIVDDGSENIRVVAFGEPAEKLLGGTTKEISEVLKREDNLSKFYGETDLVGREITVEGGVKRDDYFDQLEIRAKAIGFPEPIEETKRILEKLDRD